MNHFQISWNRWVTLVAGVYVMLLAGNVFSYGSVSDEVSSRLNATVEEKQLIGVAGYVGLWTNVIGGTVFDSCGARPTMLGGTLMAATGYTCMYLALSHQWDPLTAVFAWGLVGHGSGWLYIGVLFANLKNFDPSNRGYAVGVMSCFFGVSATVMVTILDGCIGGSIGKSGTCTRGFLGGSVTHYMGFLAIAVSVVGVMGSVLTHVDSYTLVHDDDDHPYLRFNLMIAGVLTLVIFICAGNAYALAVNPSIRTWADYVLFFLLALFLALPACANTVAIQAPILGSYRELQAIPADEVQPRTTVADPQAAESLAKDRRTQVSRVLSPRSHPGLQRETSREEGLGPLDVIYLGHFWGIWIVFGTTVGSYIATLNNLVAISTSVGLGTLTGHLCIILATGSDTIARFVAGYVASHGGMSLTCLLPLGPLLVCIGQFMLIESGTSMTVYTGSILIGLADGFMWSLGPLTTGKSFGLRRAGQNFGLVVLGAAAFGLLLMMGLVPAAYNDHLRPGEKRCHGHGCFQLLHVVSSMLAVMSLVLAVCLHARQQRMEGFMRRVTVQRDTMRKSTKPSVIW